MTAPDVRGAHHEQAATLTDDDLTSPLRDDDDTVAAWPHTLWGGAHTVRHYGPLPLDLTPEDMDPADIVGWIA